MSRWQRIAQALERSSWSLQQLRGTKVSSTRLPVELLEDVPNLGPAGSISMVNHGYARNYLLPNRLATVRRGKQSGSIAGVGEDSAAGTSGSPQQAVSAEEDRRLAAAHHRKRLEAAVKKLTTVPLTIRRKAGESGKLDKPIAAEDVADAVARQLQIEIVPQLVGMGGEVLSTTGDYQLPLKLLLPGGERAQLDVKVVST